MAAALSLAVTGVYADAQTSDSANPGQSAPCAGNAPAGGYGPGMMYGGRGGYGPGMMYGEPGGHGGWMGPGMMYGSGGPYADENRSSKPLDLSPAQVRAHFQRMLFVQGNPHIKVGDVKEKDSTTITADIVTKDGSLVQRYEIDRHTGFMRPAPAAS